MVIGLSEVQLGQIVRPRKGGSICLIRINWLQNELHATKSYLIPLTRNPNLHFREWRMVPGASLPPYFIKQSNTLKHRRQVSGHLCYTHTQKGVLLLCLPHHSMHGDVLYDINPFHTTPWEWWAHGGGRDHSAVTHRVLLVGFYAHPWNVRGCAFDWQVRNDLWCQSALHELILSEVGPTTKNLAQVARAEVFSSHECQSVFLPSCSIPKYWRLGPLRFYIRT